MAVLAYRGDLRHLSCDAWYLPTDFRLVVAPYWTEGDPALAAAVTAARAQLPEQWGEDGVRVLPAPVAPAVRATPVLAAIPNRGTDDWAYHRETLRQFVDVAVRLDRPAHLAETRQRRLLAVPLIGTGISTWRPDSAQHVIGLLDALDEESERADVDLAVVVRGEARWSAVQALRRRRVEQHGVDPELVDLTHHAERLADLARTGSLVLFTGAGVGLPAGLPDWKRLLSDLAQWVGFDEAAAERLTEMDLLDQAALIGSRAGGEKRLADEVARRLTAPHHSLAHGLLANLPVRENVTLNYDQLFELAAEGAGSPVGVLPYEPAQERWLLKLHGCIARDRRKDIVLTRGDYLSLGEHRAALTGLVQALLVTRHMLFVGFGLTDDHLHAVIHDVRRALGSTRNGTLGTALLLQRDELQEELWAKDLEYVAMGGADVPAAARRLEMFLDHLLLLTTTSDAHLFDSSFDAVLTEDERQLRDALAQAVEGLALDQSSAGRRVRSLLSEFGQGAARHRHPA